MRIDLYLVVIKKVSANQPSFLAAAQDGDIVYLLGQMLAIRRVFVS